MPIFTRLLHCVYVGCSSKRVSGPAGSALLGGQCEDLEGLLRVPWNIETKVSEWVSEWVGEWVSGWVSG